MNDVDWSDPRRGKDECEREQIQQDYYDHTIRSTCLVCAEHYILIDSKTDPYFCCPKHKKTYQKTGSTLVKPLFPIMKFSY